MFLTTAAASLFLKRSPDNSLAKLTVWTMK
jgi:hypothetical protein